jgi:hypothetical protein
MSVITFDWSQIAYVSCLHHNLQYVNNLSVLAILALPSPRHVCAKIMLIYWITYAYNQGGPKPTFLPVSFSSIVRYRNSSHTNQLY